MTCVACVKIKEEEETAPEVVVFTLANMLTSSVSHQQHLCVDSLL